MCGTCTAPMDVITKCMSLDYARGRVTRDSNAIWKPGVVAGETSRTLPRPRTLIRLIGCGLLIRCSRTNHPILHGQPRTPTLLCSIQLLITNALQWLQERNGFFGVHVVLLLAGPPAAVFGAEEIVAALAVLHGRDACLICVAKEAVQDAGLVESGNDETSYIRY